MRDLVVIDEENSGVLNLGGELQVPISAFVSREVVSFFSEPIFA